MCNLRLQYTHCIRYTFVIDKVILLQCLCHYIIYNIIVASGHKNPVFRSVQLYVVSIKLTDPYIWIGTHFH